MWRKRNPHALNVEMQIGTAIMENRMEVPPKKLKTEPSYDPAKEHMAKGIGIRIISG